MPSYFLKISPPNRDPRYVVAYNVTANTLQAAQAEARSLAHEYWKMMKEATGVRVVEPSKLLVELDKTPRIAMSVDTLVSNVNKDSAFSKQSMAQLAKAKPKYTRDTPFNAGPNFQEPGVAAGATVTDDVLKAAPPRQTFHMFEDVPGGGRSVTVQASSLEEAKRLATLEMNTTRPLVSRPAPKLVRGAGADALDAATTIAVTTAPVGKMGKGAKKAADALKNKVVAKEAEAVAGSTISAGALSKLSKLEKGAEQVVEKVAPKAATRLGALGAVGRFAGPVGLGIGLLLGASALVSALRKAGAQTTADALENGMRAEEAINLRTEREIASQTRRTLDGIQALQNQPIRGTGMDDPFQNPLTRRSAIEQLLGPGLDEVRANAMRSTPTTAELLARRTLS